MLRGVPFPVFRGATAGKAILCNIEGISTSLRCDTLVSMAKSQPVAAYSRTAPPPMKLCARCRERRAASLSTRLTEKDELSKSRIKQGATTRIYRQLDDSQYIITTRVATFSSAASASSSVHPNLCNLLSFCDHIIFRFQITDPL